MSKETKERGDKKREEIRRIFGSLVKENVKEKKTKEDMLGIIKRHAQVMMNLKPQEKSLVVTVVLEISRDYLGFINKLGIKNESILLEKG